MPIPHDNQHERQAAIRDILATAPVGTQQALVEALTALGFEATQSSVSRDLKELGAIKTSAGYELAGSGHDGDRELAAVASLVRTCRPAGPNLLVIGTAIGAAQRVALALDRSGWRELVGNIGGDDTVFAATATSADQRSLIGRIERAIRA